MAVYPRWRGEHSVYDIPASYFGGLSPLARGTRSNLTDHNAITRFIPAGAGNTVAKAADNRAQSVYPRWRGEH